MSETESAHRYQIGQTVQLSRGFGYAKNTSAGYEITALLPSNGEHYQYRIRNFEENFERVAAENEMTLRN